MKKRDALKKIREHENALAIKHAEKLHEFEAKMNLENLESNYNRARSVMVGTSFGVTTEIMMRGDGGRHLWCQMQPVEVIELIYQLAANVGCLTQLTPRKDFSSWRDWRVSDAEKKHLNGHVQFVNDMAVFQKLGAVGYNDDEAKRIMDILAEVKEYANENDNSKILLKETEQNGAPHLMVGEEDGLLHNKLAIKDNKILYMAGGNGGTGGNSNEINEMDLKNETMAINKSKNGRKVKRTAKTS